MTSLRQNVVASYAGQIYAALIGFVMLPVYLRYLGAEAYGLVGFFTMLQTWFLLLDLGLTPTLGRELARFRAGVVTGPQAATVVRTLEWVVGGLGVLGAVAVGLGAGWIARHWLEAQQLAPAELRASVLWMGVVIGLRAWNGLYRGGLAGLERMVPLNLANVALATLRSVGVLVVFIGGGVRPSAFFAYQGGAAVVELVVLSAMFYRALPMGAARLLPTWRSLEGLLGLSGGMAFLTGAWIVFSQTDRLILSWFLDLRDYGYFAVAVTLAGSIAILAAPLGQVLQPRFTLLVAQQRPAELVFLYRVSTQFTAAVAFAIAGGMTCFAEPLLRAWTGHDELARAGARILPLYAVGNALAALLGLAFLVQFAHGRIRWQVLGNCLFGVIWVPGAYLAARRFGAVGTGWVWLVGNLAFLLFWLPGVHRRLLPGLWARWLFGDVGTVLLAVTAGAAVAGRLDLAAAGRAMVLGIAALVVTLLALAGLLAGNETRRLLLDACRRFALLKPAR